MPLLFSRLCDLFSDLEQIAQDNPAVTTKVLQSRLNNRITQWFGSLNIRDPATDIDRVALLSAIFPKKRTDRVYSLKPDSLSKRLRRVLRLGAGRWPFLDNWKTPGRGDLGECVLRLLREAEHPIMRADRQVTVEEIDNVLAGIAKGNRFSSPNVRNANVKAWDTDDGLKEIYPRLQSREAKWLTRMILKDYAPLEVPEYLVYRFIDAQLPMAMKVHDNFEDALKMLGERYTVSSDDHAMQPQIGVKVGRPSYRPARGIKHAVQTIKGRKMSVEKKYDGEYCQVHVDLRCRGAPFQLFSKSGKDSTMDRLGLHDSLLECLRIGSEDCAIAQKCILEGEMVVWSDRENKILDFCKIRKHVSRTGSFLGTLADSQPHPWEHLMIVFYDILLLDEHSLLSVPHASRRKLLEQLVLHIPGRADLVERRELDFSHPRAPIDLQVHFAQAIANRWEGLVLKPSDEPYFGPAQRVPNTYPSCWLKMKKDYIAGLGDTADFAVVGAGYDVHEATRRGDKRLNWTHFHIACLKNKAAVINLHAKPEYVVLDAVTQSISPKDITWLNQHGQFRSLDVKSRECSDLSKFEMTAALAAKMTVAFRRPFVFEVFGSGFEKPPNSDNLRLRWPRVAKIHQDRDWQDAITMDELQMKAAEAMGIPLEVDLPDEVVTWQTRLDAASRGSRKAMLLWDSSQYEESGEEDEISPANVMSKPSMRARSQRPVTAPLVRMDTNEMTLGEHRLPNGEVGARPISQGSQASAASISSLSTPPTSSPSASLEMASTLRKRESYEVDGTPTKVRKPKRSHNLYISWARSDGRNSKSRDVITIDDDSEPPAQKKQRHIRDSRRKPLIETTNASNLTQPSAPSKPANADLDRTPSTEPFLVRKIPALTDPRFLPKSRRQPWKTVIDPSSTPREATASEYSTQTTHNSPHNSSRRSQLSSNPRPNRQHMSTQVDMEDTTPAPLEIPDLRHRRVMLTPEVKDNPQLNEDYIVSRLSEIIPLPTVSTTTAAFPPTPPPSNPSIGEEVILLTDIKHEHETGLFLLSLLPCLPSCGYSIAVWNWRIVKLPPDHLPEPGSEEVQRFYLCKLSWDADKRETITTWRDGKSERVHENRFWELPKLSEDGSVSLPCEPQPTLPPTPSLRLSNKDSERASIALRSSHAPPPFETAPPPAPPPAQQTTPPTKPLQLSNTLLNPVKLSPSVYDNPHILQNYVQGRLSMVITHPCEAGPTPIPTPRDPSNPPPIILLIDSTRSTITKHSMESVIG